MGMIEKLKGISNWQTTVVICFYLAAVLSVVIIAIVYDIVWLIAGGSTTLGIVASSLTNAARLSISTNSTKSDGKEQLNTVERAVAELSTVLVELKSEVELIKINGEVKRL